MKNTFMDGIRYEEQHGPEIYGPQVGKLRRDFYELITGKVSEENVDSYVRRLMVQPQNFGENRNALVWALGKPADMPSDACKEFVCQPTFLATAFIIYVVQHYDAVRYISGIDSFLHDALNGCLWGGFGGHGYEYVEGLLDTMSIFADSGMSAFLESYPQLNPEFTNAFEEAVKYIEEELCTGKERNVWNNDSYEKVAAPLLLKLKPSAKQQLLFVYGTLMHGGSAEGHLSDCKYIGKAILKDYAMFNLGSFPGIVPKKGEWVEGELYIIHGGDFSGLDRYEGEGNLYRRELVTVESSSGPQQAWAYVYLEKPEGETMNEPWIKNNDDVIWYAVYGSSLCKERFLCYVRGGICRENGREYDGCTNKQLVSDKDDHAWFPGHMYFGNKSRSWNGKGVAFYDPNASGKTFMRMYKVTRQQLIEIREMEGPSEKWYGRIHALGIHADGSPIYTLTSETHRPANDPDESYLSLISRALTEENGFTKKDADRYLAGCLSEREPKTIASERFIGMPASLDHIDKNVNVLKQAAEYILNNKTEEARALIREDLPFIPIKKESRSYSTVKQMEQFFNDGFIDRYFGTKLINPGMLRIFSEKLLGKFTLQVNGETFESQVIYRDFQPSMDHIVPISRGGTNEPSNWATTSVKGNSAKSIFTLEQLNWNLYPKGDIHNWDGLSGLFVEIVEKEPELKKIKGGSTWYNATKQVMEKFKGDFIQDGKTETYTDKNADVFKQAAEYLLIGKLEEAEAVIQECYSYIPTSRESRQYSAVQQMEQFFKDGFIDRYFGIKQINPGMLRLLSEKLPEEFPYQPHWKTDECHMAYWDYQPTMDHIVPITLGGKNDSSNWVTTSMKGNLAKKNYTLEQLNWRLYPEGVIREWDGLSELFVEIVEKEPEFLQVDRINYWYRATKQVMDKYKKDFLPDGKAIP